MSFSFFLLVLIILGLGSYYFGKSKALALKQNDVVHSLPKYYGYYALVWFATPALIIVSLWLIFSEGIVTNQVISSLPDNIKTLPTNELTLILNDIKNKAAGNLVAGESFIGFELAAETYNSYSKIAENIIIYSSIVLGLISFIFAYISISGKLRARNRIESIVSKILLVSASIAIFATAGILLSVLFEAIRFFQIISFDDFIFGLTWSPQMAIRDDQVGSSGLFGAIPLFLGTGLISLISLTVAVPVGLMTAIYLSEYAPSRGRAVTKPMLEVLSGIPTVVYGFFAAITLAPFIRDFGETLGMNIASESALGVGLVMGIMIIPLVSSLSDDVISAVPQAMREGSYGLGATKSETIKRVIIPAALPGIVGGILLAASRAIGETMIVVMAAGLSARLSINPLDAVTTVTVQIVTLLVGDQEFDSPKTLAAFALGLTLFVVTLILNFYALRIVRKYREQYE